MKFDEHISFKELETKYQLLLAENRVLKAELDAFKAGLSVTELQLPCLSREPQNIIQPSATESSSESISYRSESAEKIRLFMSLFKGRDDVYAKRWDSKKKGSSGYSPVCLNEWQRGVCGKPKVPCSTCANKSYAPFDESVIENHLLGNMVTGIYPMLRDENECHHAAASSFEQVLKAASAKYVYGLTATPTRKDGHHPIIFMQCGPIRYRDDAKLQAEKRPFDHFIIPRFTSLRAPLGRNEQELTIQDYYSEIVVSEMRNQLIIGDVVNSHQQGRNCLVLTERKAHVKLLAIALSEKIPNVLSLTGKMGAKATGEIFKRISETPADRQLTLVATGKYIGEGFDEPRLDTLFLTMPISWKGTIQQYAGRLHRLFADKKEVQIYDYVDMQVKILERMYGKRLNGYASIGYKAKSGNVAADSIDIIFDNSSFLSVFNNDILAATREILIVSPFVTRRRTVQMLQHLEIAVRNGIRVVVITRPPEDYRETDQVALQGTLANLQDAGIQMIFRPNIHQKFAVADQRIVWYGSINLLSFGSAEESIMRLESPAIASELVKTLYISTVI